MSAGRRVNFISSIKGKVILALLLACFALFMAWGVSRVAFQEMLNMVEEVSAPSERLRIVNVISRRISSLDQLQKKQAFNDPRNYEKLFKQTKDLRSVLDSLSRLYPEDTLQLKRIAKLQRLLGQRDKQFINYLKVRERLVNNKVFSAQVQGLNNIMSKSAEQSDSTILATEEKTSTTTIYPDEKPRGFFSKLFGKKRPSEDNAFKIISEEKVKRDTIALSAEDRMARSLGESIKVIEDEQRKKNESFLNKEAELANANNLLINQMLDVLRQVESEVVSQIELNGVQAKKVVNTSITTISLIMLVFLLITGLLLYWILTDISRSGRYRKALELARDEAEYHGLAKQRFLSNMSHEIRTPLQSIIGYAELIKHQEYPKRSDIDAIYNSSEHLLQIVNEVLDYNRIISGKFTFSNVAFNIADVMEEVLTIMRMQAQSKSIDMIGDFDLNGVTIVKGDPFRLKQILFNLLGNAVKFTNVGQVVLSANYKRKGDALHFTFSVRDTGIGISEEGGKRIFNEFEQENGPEGQVNRKGTGLGLTIVKSLVESQGGRIYLKSKEGAGSIFTIYLTFQIAEENEGQTVANSNVSSRSQHKVWIVDDDQLILDLCRVIFEKHLIQYRCFTSPKQLLETEWDPDVGVVLIDMRMPEMDGIALCKLLKSRIDSDVKLYAVTAQVLPDEREHLFNSGFNGLVMKPFREADLLKAIAGNERSADHQLEGGDVELDLGPLKKMVLGDEEQLSKILVRFKEDSLMDIEMIRQALLHQDRDQLSLVTHRIAGRLAQVGGGGLAAEFRRYEISLRSERDWLDQNEMYMLINKLNKITHSIS